MKYSKKFEIKIQKNFSILIIIIENSTNSKKFKN
jgi:hypothetical protein